MNDEIVTVKTHDYMPYRVPMFIALLAGSMFLLYIGKYVMAGLAALLSAMVLTSYYGIRVDRKNKTYLDFTSILGIISGESKSYSTIDHVFIASDKKETTINSIVTRSFSDAYFEGFIRFDGEAVYLVTNKNSHKVEAPLKKLSEKLGVPFIDSTAF